MPRRQGDEKPNATITAAATRLRVKDPVKARKDLGTRPEWQDEAWSYYDAVPEVKHSVRFTGSAMSKVRLLIARTPLEGEGAAPVPVTLNGDTPATEVERAALAELDRLGLSNRGGDLLREATMNLDVAGEWFLVGFDEVGSPGDEGYKPETWEVHSVSEVSSTAEGTFVSDGPNDLNKRKLTENDTCIRMYQKHPRWSGLADSALAGVLGECAALVALHHQLMSETRARHNAGLFTVPNELDFVGQRTDAAEDEDDDSDPLAEEIEATFSEPRDNSDHPNATAPTILRGPAEFLTPEYVRWVDTGRRASTDLENRIEGRVKRLARGLDVPVEVTMGLQSTTYANAEQVDQNTWDDYLEPRAVVICQAWTIGFLWPNLLDLGLPWEAVRNVFVWFDPSDLLPEKDRTAAAAEALAVGAIGLPTYRDVIGFGEEDAPAPVSGESDLSIDRAMEIARMAQQLYLAVGPLLTAAEARAILKSIGAPIEGDLPPEPAPATDEPADTAAVTAAAGIPVGRQLMEIDRDLRLRLLVLADAQMTRVLERAGNKLRSRSAEFRAQLRHVQPRLAAATLGREAVTAAISEDELLDAAFETMRGSFLAWGQTAQREALELTGQVVGGFSLDERDALLLRQAQDLDEAWLWLSDTLRSLASARLYDPLAGLDGVGEMAEGLSIPPGMIREAIARAGGAAGIETLGTNAWVTVADAGTRPVGGIGTGDLVRGVLRDHGASIESYRWVYGPAARSAPFEPHRNLNGKTFETFDSPVLRNSSGFPPFEFYMPGDHKGCLCDIEPVIIGPDGEITEDY